MHLSIAEEQDRVYPKNGTYTRSCVLSCWSRTGLHVKVSFVSLSLCPCGMGAYFFMCHPFPYAVCCIENTTLTYVLSCSYVQFFLTQGKGVKSI
jgi:hypothetical protein